MLRIAGRVFATLVVLGALAPAFAADRTADEILREIRALSPPQFSAQPGEDREKALDAHFAQVRKFNARRAELIGELRKADPENAQLSRLLPSRWTALAEGGKADEALREIDEALAGTKSDSQKISYLYAKIIISANKNPDHPEAALPVVEEFARLAPKDRRTPALLEQMARLTPDAAKKAELEDRILKDFGDTPYAEMVKDGRKQRERIGKPFELEFTDAIKDTPVSIKGLKGKVVVIDFWATWCGPCVEEMPTMKKLYAEYKGKGVEFIGVSLDQPKEAGGLDSLKEFVAKNEIAWPQYYQGNYFESEFSKGWGIHGIPCVFLVDADGNLASVDARGKLETLLPEYLKKAKAGANGGGQ